MEVRLLWDKGEDGGEAEAVVIAPNEQMAEEIVEALLEALREKQRRVTVSKINEDPVIGYRLRRYVSNEH